MGNEPTQVIFDAWNTYVATTEDGPIFISFDEGAVREDLGESLPHCARVIVPIHDPNENGGPVAPENERLWAMEDELCALLGESAVRCRLVARLTHGGQRELVFHLADWETFRPPVGQWLTRYPDYEVDVSEHDGWEFFNTCIRPSPEEQLVMADRRVLEGLLKAGSDPEKPHALEYVFRGEAQGLEQVAEALAGRGYRPEGSLEVASGEIVMVKELPLDLAAVADESIANHELATQHGVDCDGWGAAVVE